MDKSKIIEGLKGFDEFQVKCYADYLEFLENDKDRDKKIRNPWMKYRTIEQLIDFFKIVDAEGLVLDGKHITLQIIGISYDYQAYKNKLLLAYPESIFDDDLVYKSDVFDSRKDAGKVNYSHEIINPFSRKDDDIIGGYCVIKNKRGEFITLLGSADLAKHRLVAKTDSFWKKWFPEMCRKTIIKKACKRHFDDVFEKIFEMDNEEIDLDMPEITLSTKQEIEDIFTLEKLEKYYKDNKEKHLDTKAGFNGMVLKRKEEIEALDANNKS